MDKGETLLVKILEEWEVYWSQINQQDSFLESCPPLPVSSEAFLGPSRPPKNTVYNSLMSEITEAVRFSFMRQTELILYHTWIILPLCYYLSSTLCLGCCLLISICFFCCCCCCCCYPNHISKSVSMKPVLVLCSATKATTYLEA